MTERIEGKPESKIIQLMKKRGYNEWGANIELATVTAAPPALKIKIDNMAVELEADDLIVSERLTNHKRSITIKNTGKTALSGTATISSSSVTDSMTQAGTGPHTHNITSLTLSGSSTDLTSGTFALTEGEIEYLDELKVGDRVIVASINAGQSYVILDRTVVYPANGA